MHDVRFPTCLDVLGVSEISGKRKLSNKVIIIFTINCYDGVSVIFRVAESHLFVGVSLADLILVYQVRWRWNHHPPPGSVHRGIKWNSLTSVQCGAFLNR